MSDIATIRETKTVKPSATVNKTQNISNDFQSYLNSASQPPTTMRPITDAEKIDMMKGWKMSLAADFPKDLKQKLEKMYSEASTTQEKWDFVNMCDGTFHYALGKEGFQPWGSDWKSRLAATIRTTEGFSNSLDIEYRNDAKRISERLKSLLN